MGNANTVNAQYDLAGDITSLTYPDGRTVAQTFDGAGRLCSVGAASCSATPVAGSYLSAISYAPAGQVTGATFGNDPSGSGTSFGALFNNRLEMTSLAYTSSNPGKTLWWKTLGWTPNGNLQSASDNVLGVTRQFAYDNLNRLTSAQDVMGLSYWSGETGQTSNTQSENVSNALPNVEQIGALGWAGGNISMSANAAVAPDGTMTAGVVTATPAPRTQGSSIRCRTLRSMTELR